MRKQAAIRASQDPVEVSRWDELAAVTLSWTCDESLEVEVRVDAPDGPLLCRAGGPGTAATGKWVQDGMTFYLQDVTGGKPLEPAHTLATTTLTLATAGEGPRGVILMYHRIAEEPWDPWSLCVSARHFAEHLEVLARLKVALPLSALRTALEQGGLPDRAVAVTFDDGYADNCLRAMPLLKESGIPATMFVAGGYLGDPRGYWWDELEQLLSQDGALDPDLYFEMHGWLRSLPLDRCRDCLGRLRRWMRAEPAARDDRRPLSAEELRLLADSPLIDIGAHTLTHPMLDALPAAEQVAEIQQSKRVLEETLNRAVKHFAYPYGACGPETPGLVAAAGFECACLASGGVFSADADLFRLPRMQVRDWDGAGFSRRLVRWLGPGG